MKFGERVYYKFDEKHPYEKQVLNDSKNYGKGRIDFFAEDGIVGVSADTSHHGRIENDPIFLFKKEELLDIDSYFRLPEKER